MTNEQPTALDLADELEQTPFQSTRYEAAAMLRRQHATLRQALEALEEIALAGMSPAPEMIDNKEAFHARQAWRFIGIAARALEPIKEALAEQPAEQRSDSEHMEPVAWMWKDGTVTSDPDRADGTWTPLYTAPQPHREVGLTDEEIDRALDATNVPELPAGYESVELEIARAVIEAYKAKQEKT